MTYEYGRSNLYHIDETGSGEVCDAFYDYSEYADVADRTGRVCAITEVYAYDLIPRATYDAAILHSIADRAMDESQPIEQRCHAALVLKQYDAALGRTNIVNRDHCRHVLADIQSVDTAAQAYRSQLEQDGASEMRAILGGQYQGLIDDPALWLIDEPTVDIKHLAEHADSTNVESIILKAAMAIENLEKPSLDDASLLRAIIETETFYEPLCKVMGLDAMAMRLRSEATKRRFERSKKYDLLERARQLQQSALDTYSMQSLVDTMQAETIEWHYRSGSYDGESEPGLLASGTINGGPLDGFEVRFRVKSIGSIARKLERYGGDQEPMDIVGFTVIASDEAALAEAFFRSVNVANDTLTLKPSPSKKQAVYVQGGPEFVDAISTRLDDTTIPYQSKTIADKPDCYQVAKYTALDANDTPIEVQFSTAKDRRLARVGMTAHVLYKQQRRDNHDVDKEELVDLLERTYAKRHSLDKRASNINERSRPRAERFWKDIDALAQRCIDEHEWDRQRSMSLAT